MPAAPVSLTESDVLAALRAFLLAILPDGVEIVRGLDNRVPEPLGPDFVVLTPIRRERWRTNVATYEDVPGAGVRHSGDGVQITVQVDAHGPESAENAQRLATLLRDEYACAFFRALGVAVQPLYAGEPRQVPFTNGEGQVEERWTVDAALAAVLAVTTPQRFAERVGIGLIEVDAAYPPGASPRPRQPPRPGPVETGLPPPTPALPLVFRFPEPRAVWVLPHGLGRIPDVSTFDAAGERIYPDERGGERETVLTFNPPAAGVAYVE